MAIHQETLPECVQNFTRMETHMKESIEVRDRLKTVEIRQDQLEKNNILNGFLGGLIGALVGSGAAPAVTKLVGFWTGH